MTPTSEQGGFYVYGTGIERPKGKKTAVGTRTTLLLRPADSGAGELLRIDHGQRIFRELQRATVRPMQGDHCGNGPLIGNFVLSKKE